MWNINCLFNFDSIDITNGGTTVTAFTIKNIQITYQLIDFGEEVHNMIMSMPNFFYKINWLE